MDKVSFGFEEVSPDEKTRRVGAVFSSGLTGRSPKFTLVLIAGCL